MPSDKPARRASPRRRPATLDDGQWHLDRRINISIIIALLLQAAVGLTWANNITFDMNNVKVTLGDVGTQVRTMDKRLDQLAIIQTQMQTMAESLRRLGDRTESIAAIEVTLQNLDNKIKDDRSNRERMWEEIRRNSRAELLRNSRAEIPRSRSD